MAEYTAKSIKSYKGLFIIRNRPTFYLDNIEIDGQTRLVIELLDNAIDEMLLKANGRITLIMCRDLNSKKYQIVVMDNGRGIPIGTGKNDVSTFKSILTELHTSGKYDTSAYAVSAGLFGVGINVPVALSEVCRAITVRPDAVASMTIKRGVPEDVVLDKVNPTLETGVTMMYQPDSSILVNTDVYCTIGPHQILNRICTQAYFSSYQLDFYVIDKLLPNKLFTTMPSDIVINTLKQMVAGIEPFWSREKFNKTEWIQSYWNVKKPFEWSGSIQQYTKSTDVDSPLKNYKIDLFYTQGIKQGNRFGIVNSLPIDSLNSDNIKTPMLIIREQMAQYIKDNTTKEFFLTKYKFPIYIAIEVQYGGAEFSSAIKSAINSPVFRKHLGSQIKNDLLLDNNKATIESLYNIMADDINTAYMESIGEKIVHTSRGRLYEKLKRPKFFSDVEKSGKMNELFITEGSSASGTKTEKDSNVGVYAISGKPKNLITKESQSWGELLKNTLKDPIYSDILTILNCDPRNIKKDQLNFQRVFLMVDGDDHGKHIAAILLGVFQLLIPELVKDGLFNVVAPPYYKLEYIGGRTANKSSNVYIRDHEHLIEWYARYIYYPAIDISIIDIHGYCDPINLTIDQYIAYVKYVLDIGNEMSNVSKSLYIDPYILESLCYCLNELDNKEHMNLDSIKEACMAMDVRYDKKHDTLTVVMQDVDHIIPLISVTDIIRESLIPMLVNIRWKHWCPMISTRTTEKYKGAVVGLYQLFTILTELDKCMYPKPLKGIGSMDNKEAFMTCMNPFTRRVFAVTDHGCLKTIFDLLGDDSEARKQLVSPPLETIF